MEGAYGEEKLYMSCDLVGCIMIYSLNVDFKGTENTCHYYSML